jgi:hypothetical protein
LSYNFFLPEAAGGNKHSRSTELHAKSYKHVDTTSTLKISRKRPHTPAAANSGKKKKIALCKLCN